MMTRRLRTICVLLVWLGLGSAPAASATQSFSVTVEVGPGAWRGVRMTNLPKAARLALRIEPDGPITVLILDSTQLSRFPAEPSSLFSANTERPLSFEVAVPRAGTYYAIFDNRTGTTERKIVLAVSASLAKRD